MKVKVGYMAFEKKKSRVSLATRNKIFDYWNLQIQNIVVIAPAQEKLLFENFK